MDSNLEKSNCVKPKEDEDSFAVAEWQKVNPGRGSPGRSCGSCQGTLDVLVCPELQLRCSCAIWFVEMCHEPHYVDVLEFLIC